MTNIAQSNDSSQTFTNALELAFAVPGCTNVAYKYTQVLKPDGKGSISFLITSLNEETLGLFMENEECLDLQDPVKFAQALQMEQGSYTILLTREEFELAKVLDIYKNMDDALRKAVQPQ